MSDRQAGRNSCEALRGSFPAAALDALSDAEMQQVITHADTCEPCRAELASMRRAASQLTYAAPLEAIDPARAGVVRARLHARARGDSRADVTPDHSNPLRDTLIWALNDPEVRVITLAPAAPRAAGALMFWNPATSQWRFIAHDLPPLDAGRAYQLWVVIDGTPTSVGLFSPDTLGRARVDARLAIQANTRPHVAVTEEPAAGSAQPTGQPVVAGATSR